jgi:deazaflavin-dependent oxidoreductase (nitroreductase family)
MAGNIPEPDGLIHSVPQSIPNAGPPATSKETSIVSDWNQKTIAEFRANGGKVGGIFDGAPLVLLHHVGAKTGTERVTPLMYQTLDDGFAVFASKAGADAHPHWFLNIVANPEIEIEVGTETVAVKARVAHGDEHDRIWTKQKQDFPQFAEYERKTARDLIPVVVLNPTG